MKLNEFAENWIASWNSRNLENILLHYAEDVEISSPMIKLAAGMESGSLKGKPAVAEYWSKAMSRIPDLHFELLDATEGVNSVALYYKSIMNKRSIEVMFFDEAGLVNRVVAHYTNQ
jgi:ketosteroid isomerase-like protein